MDLLVCVDRRTLVRKKPWLPNRQRKRRENPAEWRKERQPGSVPGLLPLASSPTPVLCTQQRLHPSGSQLTSSSCHSTQKQKQQPLNLAASPPSTNKDSLYYFCMLQTQKQVDCASFHQFQLLRSWKKWLKNNKRAVFSQSDVKWGYSEQGADATQRACRGFFQTFSKEHQ